MCEVGFVQEDEGDGLWGVWGCADAKVGEELIYDFNASKGDVLCIRRMSAKLTHTLNSKKTEGRRRAREGNSTYLPTL
jgi:hypothetical protein